MPRIYIVAVLVISMVLLVGNSLAYNPPKNLRWGMTYSEAKETLKSPKKGKKVKIEKLKPAKSLAPDNYFQAKLKNIKLLDKKVKEAYAVFTPEEKLCAVYYAFVWNNEEHPNNIFSSANKGRDQSWEFYQELVKALRIKYGGPATNFSPEKFGESISSGSRLEISWIDSTSNDKIMAAITREKKNAVIVRIDMYIVMLGYMTEEFVKMKEQNMVSDEDL